MQHTIVIANSYPLCYIPLCHREIATLNFRHRKVATPNLRHHEGVIAGDPEIAKFTT